jgi:hypothetical protein
MAFRAGIAALFAAVAACGLKPGVAGPRAVRVADVDVPGPATAVTLGLPATPHAGFDAFLKLLGAADVPYGVEGPAVEPAAPMIDLARRRERVLLLGGHPLSDALDGLAEAVPPYRWFNAGGIVVVRASADGDGILDRRVARFNVSGVSPRTALDVLMAALDPPRGRGVGLAQSGSDAVSGNRSVSVSLRDASVESVLTAIARSHGALSWTIRYDAAPASVDTASIRFLTPGAVVNAMSNVLLRRRADPEAQWTYLTVASSLTDMLFLYADRARVRISVEEAAPEPTRAETSAQTVGLPQIRLPDDPALAIAQIVSLDSRYEWSDYNGRFLVRPRPGVPGRLALLDRSIERFVAVDEPAGDAITRLAGMLGAARPFLGGGAGLSETAWTDAWASRVTVRLPGPATIREALDAIADATGWLWSVQPLLEPDRPTRLFLAWRGRGDRPDDASRGGRPPGNSGTWRARALITLSEDLGPPAIASSPASRGLPPALERDVPRLTIDAGRRSAPFEELAVRTRTPMGIEHAPRPARFDDPRWRTRPQPATVGPGRLSDALHVLLEQRPDYAIVSTDAIVSVAPSELVRSADYFMNRPIAAFAVRNVGLFRALGQLGRLIDARIEPRDWTGPGAAMLNRPVTLSVTQATPRTILNRLAGEHDGVLWSSGFEAPAGAGPAEARPEHWVLAVVPLAGGPPVRLTAGDDRIGPAALPGLHVSTPAEPPVPAPPPGTPRTTIDVPVTSRSLRTALGFAAKANRARVGLEVVAEGTPGESIRRSPEYCDLTGLTMDETLAKVQAFAPDYLASLDDGVYHVRPREPQPDTTPWLALTVERFDGRFAGLREALVAVAALGRPDADARPAPVVGGRPPAADGPIGISLGHVTVRDVLDELARRSDAVQWVVEQRIATSGPRVLLVMAGDGWSLGLFIR